MYKIITTAAAGSVGMVQGAIRNTILLMFVLIVAAAGNDGTRPRWSFRCLPAKALHDRRHRRSGCPAFASRAAGSAVLKSHHEQIGLQPSLQRRFRPDRGLFAIRDQ